MDLISGITLKKKRGVKIKRIFTDRKQITKHLRKVKEPKKLIFVPSPRFTKQVFGFD